MKKAAMFIGSIISAATIISIAVIITVNSRWLYYMDIDKLNIPQTSGISETEIIENYNYLIDYNTKFRVGEFSLPTLPSSNEGKIHFEEVRNIFLAVHFIAAAGIVLIIYSIYEAFKRKRYKMLGDTLIMTVIIPAVTGIMMAVSFEKTFVLFHKIMFRNDYWIFDPSKDPIINMLPETFFLHAAALIIILTAVIWMILLKLYLKSKEI